MNNSDNDRNDNPHMTYVLHINGYNSDNHRDFLMGYLSGIYMIIYDIYIYVCAMIKKMVHVPGSSIMDDPNPKGWVCRKTALRTDDHQKSG